MRVVALAAPLLLVSLAACGTSESSSIHPILGAAVISAGNGTTCALGGEGGMSCWGIALAGSGPDTIDGFPHWFGATPVNTPTSFTTISLTQQGNGLTGCGVNGLGAVYCWGGLIVDADGILDLGGGTPTLLGGFTNVATISMYSGHFCATRTDHKVICAGEFAGGARGTDSVTLATVDPDVSLVPSGLSPSLTATKTAQGRWFGCALRTDSLVSCWGTRQRGQLGGATGDTVHDCITTYAPAGCQPAPAPIAGGHQYVQLAAGFDQACGVLAGGVVECWGRKLGTPIGLGWDACGSSSDCPNTPTIVSVPGTVVRVAIGMYHACALVTTGDVYCWGDNSLGQLGRPGASSLTPVKVAGGFSFAFIAAGPTHTCGIELDTGAVGCWGDNAAGQLGDGTTVNRDHPVPVIVAQ